MSRRDKRIAIAVTLVGVLALVGWVTVDVDCAEGEPGTCVVSVGLP